MFVLICYYVRNY